MKRKIMIGICILGLAAAAAGCSSPYRVRKAHHKPSKVAAARQVSFLDFRKGCGCTN